MAINLKNLRFAYPESPDEHVLGIAEWSVSAGQQVFVHGPSGSGKSTLLNLLSGLLPCRDGEISILGERLDKMSGWQRDRFRANHIGYVFQRFNLIPYLSAVDNVELPRSFSSEPRSARKADDAATLLSALNVPESEWRKPTARLSAGQQQRVAIARALVNQPELLIADEPTSSLDVDNRDNFMSLLMSWVSEHNMTLIFVSHDMGLSQHFSRVEALGELNQPAQAI